MTPQEVLSAWEAERKNRVLPTKNQPKFWPIYPSEPSKTDEKAVCPLVGLSERTRISEHDLLKLLIYWSNQELESPCGVRRNWLTGLFRTHPALPRLFFSFKKCSMLSADGNTAELRRVKGGRTYPRKVGQWLRGKSCAVPASPFSADVTDSLKRLEHYAYAPGGYGLVHESWRSAPGRSDSGSRVPSPTRWTDDDQTRTVIPHRNSHKTWLALRGELSVQSVYHNWYNLEGWSHPPRGMKAPLNPNRIVNIHVFGGRGDVDPRQCEDGVYCAACHGVFRDELAWLRHSQAYRGWVQCPWDFVDTGYTCGKRRAKIKGAPPVGLVFNNWGTVRNRSLPVALKKTREREC